MLIPFEKYQGTGNDFVIIDNREGKYGMNEEQIRFLCDRRFGIGADGLMLLEDAKGYDFKMVYYNADGKESSMCGNGGRCLVAFAFNYMLFEEECRFLAIDGPHDAVMISAEDNFKDYYVSLKMQDVNEVKHDGEQLVIDTGSPHYLQFVEDVDNVDVFTEGRKVRYNDTYKGDGINVNFLQMKDGVLNVRTYERGVENETLSCGTGVTAAALAASVNGLVNGESYCKLETKGGRLQVRFKKGENNSFTNVWLDGPATFVFEGDIDI